MTMEEYLALVDVSGLAPTENDNIEAEFDAPEAEEVLDFVTGSK